MQKVNREMWDTFKHTKIHIKVVPGKEYEAEKISKVIMPENSPIS